MKNFRFSKPTSASAFSLVEVTVSLGILAFAFVATLGMLPIGLSTFQNSADKMQTTQIAQRLLSEAQQTPFANLPAIYNNVAYFDGEGEQISNASGSSVSGPAGYVYSAMVEPVTDDVQDNNDVAVGISKTRTQLILVKIAKNRQVDALTPDEKPLAQFAFAVADVKL